MASGMMRNAMHYDQYYYYYYEMGCLFTSEEKTGA